MTEDKNGCDDERRLCDELVFVRFALAVAVPLFALLFALPLLAAEPLVALRASPFCSATTSISVTVAVPASLEPALPAVLAIALALFDEGKKLPVL